jgi:hypothetical protein
MWFSQLIQLLELLELLKVGCIMVNLFLTAAVV